MPSNVKPAVVFAALFVAAGLVLGLPACGAARRIKTDRKIVALTFDDGPNPPFTEKLLGVLAEKKVKATFFLIGRQIETHPETARKILAAGHETGGHSCDWSTLAFRSRRHVESQLDRMDAAFNRIGVTNLALFRAPNGLLSPGQDSILKSRGLQHIGADVVAGDWKTRSADKIHAVVVKKTRPGSIIVLHDGGGDRSATVVAVARIIDDLRAQGYVLLPVGELLELK